MQVKVYTFASKIPSEYHEAFMRLMKEWGNCPSVGYAFYDIDVLKMKLKEAMDEIIQKSRKEITEMIKFSVTRHGVPLDPDLYTWNESTRTFSTNQSNLVLNFKGIDGLSFKTKSNCTFITGSDCVFTTWSDCVFKTGKNCVVIRDDIFKVIKLEKKSNHIQLNDWLTPGYKEIKERK